MIDRLNSQLHASLLVERASGPLSFNPANPVITPTLPSTPQSPRWSHQWSESPTAGPLCDSGDDLDEDEAYFLGEEDEDDDDVDLDDDDDYDDDDLDDDEEDLDDDVNLDEEDF